VPTPKTGENKSFAHYFEEEIAGIFESAKNELPSTNSDKMERLVQGRISEILEELKSISTVEAKVAAANKDFDEAKKSSRNRLNKYLKQLRAFIDAGKPTEKPAPRTRKTLPKPVAKVVKRKPAKAKAKA
jgi:C4-dicarboxylate-specific signal transduction histidine kinase